MDITQHLYGTTARGEQVDAFTLDNGQGITVRLITYGARIISCITPDRHGVLEEITHCSPHLSELETSMPYHGATIGRYTNRIAGKTIRIDGADYELSVNQPHCQLHGGPGGLHQVVWDAIPIKQEGRVSVVCTCTSPDGDQGFPGSLEIALTVTLTSSGELIFLYNAEASHPTYVSLTNHTYWNLSGSGSIFDHLMMINASDVVEVDENLLPSGSLIPVQGTCYDFTVSKPIGRDASAVGNSGGYDTCYVIHGHRTGTLVLAARAEDPASGRMMEVLTDAPGVQFYTDNFGDPPHRGFCLEAGELPDAMHHPSFPQPLVRPGETYRQCTIHRFFS